MISSRRLENSAIGSGAWRRADTAKYDKGIGRGKPTCPRTSRRKTNKTPTIHRRTWLGAALSAAWTASPLRAFAQGAGQPIRIGSTLALTGPLSATAQVHKLVGEIYIEQLNRRGGLLGRRVEWVLKDDQSKPDLARTLYEQLITSDKVDLLMGPYATGNILSAMGVAQRYGKMLVHHTFGVPSLAKYDMQFPAWAMGPDPGVTVTNTVFEARRTGPSRRNRGGGDEQVSVDPFMSLGARETLKKRGLTEALFPRVGIGNRSSADRQPREGRGSPTSLGGAIGLDGNLLLDAMKKIDYVPPQHFTCIPLRGRWFSRRRHTGRFR